MASPQSSPTQPSIKERLSDLFSEDRERRINDRNFYANPHDDPGPFAWRNPNHQLTEQQQRRGGCFERLVPSSGEVEAAAGRTNGEGDKDDDTGDVVVGDDDDEGRSSSPLLHLLESLPRGLIVQILEFLRPSSQDVLQIASASKTLSSKLVTEWGGWKCAKEECGTFTFCDGVVADSSTDDAASIQRRPPCSSRYARTLCQACETYRPCPACTATCSGCQTTACKEGSLEAMVGNCLRRGCNPDSWLCVRCALDHHCRGCHKQFCPSCMLPEYWGWFHRAPFCDRCFDRIDDRWDEFLQSPDSYESRCAECKFPNGSIYWRTRTTSWTWP
jgi:hypothetical protein